MNLFKLKFQLLVVALLIGFKVYIHLNTRDILNYKSIAYTMTVPKQNRC